MSNEISLFHTKVTDTETDAVAAVLRSGQLVMGEHVRLFEAALGAHQGASPNQVVSCASGTDALVLALESMGIGMMPPMDEVLVPAMTFSATAEAVLRVGAKPVVADVSDEHYMLTERIVRGHLRHNSRMRAVIVVHLYGWPNPELLDIRETCNEFGVALIEDCAQAFGAQLPNGRPVGTVGDAAAFSFYPTKPLGGIGDGGAMVCYPSAGYARSRRNHGRRQDGSQLSPGYNSRMDETDAVVLTMRLADYTHNLAQRVINASRYAEHLRGITLFNGEAVIPAPYVFPVRVSRKRRQEIRDALQRKGIQTGVHYCPDLSGLDYLKTECPVAQMLASEQLSLPVHHLLRGVDVERVITELQAVL